MMVFSVARLQAVLLFYRSVVWFTASISALLLGAVLLPALHEGWAKGLLPRLLLIKWLTGPVVWYLAERSRPDQYWFYYNLGASRGSLWAGVAIVDTLLFLGLAVAVKVCYSHF